ncbi:MAG: hypothetical protein KatS3mg039_0104 [Candidatus Kapaibacterium sp.]|nr:MAG: hypothetical protein KatS3mg039_0104 [Candidatus Kapabacteria bacterium]
MQQQSIGLVASIGAGIVAAALLALLASTGEWYAVAAIGAGIGTLYVLVRYWRLQWVLFFAIMPVYFFQSDVEVTAFDLAMAVYLATLLLGWLVWAITLRRSELIWRPADAILWLALIASVGSVAVAVVRGTSVLNWAREWALIAMVAYYFVFRSAFASQEQFRFYAMLLVLLSVSLSVIGALNFRQQVIEAIYAFQIRGVKGVSAVYLIGFFLSISLLLFRERWWERLLWFTTGSLITGGIVISYTRTIWVGSIVSIAVMLLVLPAVQRIRLLVVMGIAAVVLGGIAQLVFGNVVTAVGRVLLSRALTLKTATKQASVIERRDEMHRIVQLLSRRPDIAIAGVAPGGKFVYYDTYLGKPKRTHFLHNGMVGLMFKFGVPVGLTFYLFHLLMLVKSIRCYFRSRRTWLEPYVLPFTLTLLGTTVMDWTTNAFFIRSGCLFLGMLYAGVAIADRLLGREESYPSVMAPAHVH